MCVLHLLRAAGATLIIASLGLTGTALHGARAATTTMVFVTDDISGQPGCRYNGQPCQPGDVYAFYTHLVPLSQAQAVGKPYLVPTTPAALEDFVHQAVKNRLNRDKAAGIIQSPVAQPFACVVTNLTANGIGPSGWGSTLYDSIGYVKPDQSCGVTVIEHDFNYTGANTWKARQADVYDATTGSRPEYDSDNFLTCAALPNSATFPNTSLPGSHVYYVETTFSSGPHCVWYVDSLTTLVTRL